MKTFNRISIALILTLGSLSLLFASGGKSGGLKYPKARKVDQVDSYHGIKVADPYRWMEEMTSPEIKSWIDAQEELLDGYVKDVAVHRDIKQRILQIRDVDSYSMPSKKGSRTFFSKTAAGQNQSVIYFQENADAEPKILMDPKTFLQDEESRLSGYRVSPDGKRIFYSVSKGQSVWTEDHIMEVDSKTAWPETLTGVGGISWAKDGEGFFYIKYKVPEKGKEMQAELKDPKIYYHAIGTSQSQDQFIYARPDNPTWLLGTRITHDGKYLIVTVAKGSSFSGWVDFILYKDLKNPESEILQIVAGEDAKYAFEGSNGPTFWIRTTLDAPRGRLVAVDISKPERKHWLEVIPQSEETISTVSEIGDYLVLRYLRDALPVVKVFDHKGNLRYEVGMPSIALVGGFPDDRNAQEAYYQLWGLLEPGTIYKLNLKTGKSQLFKRPQLKFTPENFVIKQIFYQSKDGTRVPMLIAHKKGLKPNKQTPAFMYAYGAIAWAAMPWYQPQIIAWMEMGGVYAFPNIRGGGEYGDKWYEDGILHKKQNGIDDFIAAAEWLIDNGYTTKEKMIANGGSASGVLPGAAIVQRPDLFGAALIEYPRLDMIRYHLFTGATARVKELGSPEDAEQFKTLYSYSPYHNLKKNKCYPATLVLAGENDEVTPPLHGYKFTAALQEVQGCDNPALIKVVRESGHYSYGRDTEEFADTWADVWSFMVRALNLDVSDWKTFCSN